MNTFVLEKTLVSVPVLRGNRTEDLWKSVEAFGDMLLVGGTVDYVDYVGAEERPTCEGWDGRYYRCTIDSRWLWIDADDHDQAMSEVVDMLLTHEYKHVFIWTRAKQDD